MEEQPNINKTIHKYRWLRRLARVILGVLIFFILLVLFVRSPWGQNVIVQQGVNYVKGKTGTEVQIEKAFITFDGNVVIDGVFLADEKGDTLLYSNHLEANLSFMPLIKGTGFTLNNATWDGLTAHIYRDNITDGFNYQFLIDAFVVEGTTTTSKPFQLKLGTADLANFDVSFNDRVNQLDAHLKFEEFHLKMNTLDLENMIVKVDDVYLKNANSYYHNNSIASDIELSKMVTPNDAVLSSDEIKDDSNDSPLPKISVGNLRFDDVKLNYTSVVDGIAVNTSLSYFETAIAKADIAASDYKVNFVNLKDSEVFVNTQTANKTPDIATTGTTTAFTWPDLSLQVKNLNFQNNLIDYRVDGALPEEGVFNTNAIAVNNLDLQSSVLEYENKSAIVHIENIQFAEAGGLGLKQLQLKLTINDNKLVLNDLKTQINKNKLRGGVTVNYSSMDAFIKAPEKSSFDARIPRYEFYLNDLYRFLPYLRNNLYVRALVRKPVTGSLKAKGTLDKIDIPNLLVNWGTETAIIATGTVSNPTSIETINVDLPNLKMRSTRDNMLQFVNEEDLGFLLPQRISLNANIAGSTKQAIINALFTTTDGNLKVDGSFNNDATISFDAIASAQNLKLSHLLQKPELGDLTITINASGSGTELTNLDGTIDATINSFSYNDYPLKEIPVKGSFKNGKGMITSSYKDKNIEVSLESNLILENDIANATATIDIDGIDLQAFKVTSRNVRAGGQITASFKGNDTNYDLSSSIANGIAVYDNQSFLLGDVSLKAFARPDTTSVDIKNKMLNLQLRSNTDPARLITAIQRHIDRYLTKTVATDSIAPVVMNIKGSLTPAPILRSVIFPDLQALDTLKLAVDFNERNRKLDADIAIPYLKYANSEVDSLLITSRSDAQNLKFDFGFKSLTSGILNVERTEFTGIVEKNQLGLEFTSYDNTEKLIHIASTLSRKRTDNNIQNLELRVLVDDLILNKQNWTISKENIASYGDGKLAFNNFKIANGDQSIVFDSQLPENSKEHLGIIFNNFELQNILGILNLKEPLAAGIINGQVVLEDIFNKMGIIANLSIKDLKAMKVPLGKLTLDAQSAAGDQYLVDLKVNGDLIDLAVDGSYTASRKDALLDMQLALNKLELKMLSDIAPQFFKNGKGAIAGNFKLTGTTAAPIYDGVLNFKNAGITPVRLDTPFNIVKESVVINNDGVILDSFTVQDVNNNNIVANGTIGTTALLDPTFDLTINADNFTVLDATAADNELYYGKATFTASATVKGDLTLPIVQVELTVNKDTDVYYVMPAKELEIVQRDGIVQFVNKEDPDDILTRTEEESATLTGFDITANIKVGNKAFVNIIVDPATGDNLRVAGNGDLRFNLYPNGRMALAGRYEINEGHYELSLYEIVSRRFELAKGGSISWTGDPYDANLDVSAIYKIDTSASALMASQTSGASPTTKEKFRQVLPFLVYLNVGGELLQPEISFRLDLPEEEQGAIGGQVYGRLQQLNTQDQELNKQVFSLLVLNKFFPISGADGSTGGTAAIARDNLNQALSDQLNQYGGKLLGNTGIDLNFGVNSFTDYQGAAPQDRTQLDIAASKKLFNDRLIVSVGSEVDIQGSAPNGEETPVLGNVSLEYFLTETGKWRLKGFRRNQFDNVIDGQLVISGLSLIFSREFNEFSNLFKTTIEEQAAKEERQKEKLKARKEEELRKENDDTK